jgi:hypothetical protein
MIKYLLEDLNTIVSIDSSDPDAPATIEITGANVDIAKSAIATSYGMYGHSLISSPTPIDLAIAMAKEPLKKFSPRILEGQAVIENYESPIPEGAVS